MARFIQSDGRMHGVVAGVRHADGRWLCIRRSRHVPAPLKVCFPGGGLEQGEGEEAALIREMREELGLAVRPVKKVWTWASPTSALMLFGWLAEAVDGKPLAPHPDEVEEILWLTGEEAVNHPDAMPSNRAFVAALEQFCAER